MRSLLIVAGWAVATGASLGQVVVEERGREVVGTSGHSVLRHLNQRLPQVTFTAAPLEQVVEWLAQQTELDVVVRWQALEEAGLERERPICLHVRHLRLSQVLWLILNEAGGPDLKLAYLAGDGLLVISTAEDLERQMVTKVYDVADLLGRVPDFGAAPRIDPAQWAGETRGCFATPGAAGSEGYENKPGTSSEELRQVVIDTVEPWSWAEHGGLGTIRAYGHVLVVRNSLRVHQQLGGVSEERTGAARE